MRITHQIKQIDSCRVGEYDVTLIRLRSRGVNTATQNILVMEMDGSSEVYEWEDDTYSIPELLEQFGHDVAHAILTVLHRSAVAELEKACAREYVEPMPVPQQVEIEDDRIDAEYSSFPWAGYEVPDSIDWGL